MKFSFTLFDAGQKRIDPTAATAEIGRSPRAPSQGGAVEGPSKTIGASLHPGTAQRPGGGTPSRISDEVTSC